jgi:hypothetical protein
MASSTAANIATRLAVQRSADVEVIGAGTSAGRSCSAAAARLGACSAATAASSTSSRVPGSRLAKKSGRRLKVVWPLGQ